MFRICIQYTYIHIHIYIYTYICVHIPLQCMCVYLYIYTILYIYIIYIYIYIYHMGCTMHSHRSCMIYDHVFRPRIWWVCWIAAREMPRCQRYLAHIMVKSLDFGKRAGEQSRLPAPIQENSTQRWQGLERLSYWVCLKMGYCNLWLLTRGTITFETVGWNRAPLVWATVLLLTHP